MSKIKLVGGAINANNEGKIAIPPKETLEISYVADSALTLKLEDVSRVMESEGR